MCVLWSDKQCVFQEQEKSGRRHGCVLATSDDAVTLVLLVGERLDPNYRIRSKLGHSFSAHPWSEHTVAKVTRLQSQLRRRGEVSFVWCGGSWSSTPEVDELGLQSGGTGCRRLFSVCIHGSTGLF